MVLPALIMEKFEKDAENVPQKLVAVVDEILKRENLSSLSHSNVFHREEITEDNFLYISKKMGCAPLRLSFTSYGIEYGVDDFYEFDFFGVEELFKNPTRLKEILVSSIFGRIVIQRCALGFNFVTIKREDGSVYISRGMHFGCLPLVLFPLCKTPVFCKTSNLLPVWVRGQVEK